MKLRAIIPVIVIAFSVAATVIAVRATTAPLVNTNPVSLPAAPVSPYQTSLSGTGIVEPRSESLQIATEIAGVVVEVPVTPGDRVERGEVLFRLDERDASSRLDTAKAELARTRESRARLDRLPRAESVLPLRAAVAEAQSQLASARNDESRLRSASNARAVALVELERQEFAVRTAETRLAKAQAELDLALAGSWEPDLWLASTDVLIAESKVHQIETELARLTIRAPISGQVLERNVRVGQFAEPRSLADPLIVLGDTSVLHVRVEIDETEAWRFVPGQPAMAMVRGNPSLTAPLAFVRAEPSVLPKRSLTGASTERTDTRVLRVLYALAPDALPVRVGQLLDVRIEAPSSEPVPKSTP